jgi:hypothetical protein
MSEFDVRRRVKELKDATSDDDSIFVACVVRKMGSTVTETIHGLVDSSCEFIRVAELGSKSISFNSVDWTFLDVYAAPQLPEHFTAKNVEKDLSEHDENSTLQKSIESELVSMLCAMNPHRQLHAEVARASRNNRSDHQTATNRPLHSFHSWGKTFPIDKRFRRRLMVFFEWHDPFRLPTVAETVRQYAGNESSLFALLRQEFGEEPSDDLIERLGLLEPLPQGWECVESTRGDIYYRHSSLSQRTWSHPGSKRSQLWNR